MMIRQKRYLIQVHAKTKRNVLCKLINCQLKFTKSMRKDSISIDGVALRTGDCWRGRSLATLQLSRMENWLSFGAGGNS